MQVSNQINKDKIDLNSLALLIKVLELKYVYIKALE